MPDPAGRPAAVDTSGVIAVAGTANFREIGPVSHVRRGVLFRADALSDLDDGGRRQLGELGVRTVVDLRQDVERGQHPNAIDGLRIVVHDLPLLGSDFDVRGVRDLGDLYRWILDERGEQVAAVVRALGAGGALPAVVHCAAGKDRTGIIAALVLSATGVPADVIAADYARSSALLTSAAYDRLRRRAEEAGLRAQRIALAGSSPAGVLRTVLRGIDAEWGGAGSYLRAHGVRDEELAVLRRELRPAA